MNKTHVALKKLQFTHRILNASLVDSMNKGVREMEGKTN
jgi:hypothetical protein